MPLWGRRLLVAMAIWVAALVFSMWAPTDDVVGGLMLVFAAPLTLGLIFGWLARLPWWLPVGLLAFPGAYFLMFTVVAWHSLLDHDVPWPVILAYPALGFLIVSWFFSPGFPWPKIGVSALLIAGFAATGPVEELKYDREFEEMIASSGVPLVAPVIPGHDLVSSSSFPVNGEIALTYASPDGKTEVEVYLHPGASDPEEMCLDPVPRYPIDADATCRQAAPGVWVRTAGGFTRALGRAGGVTMQMIANDVPEEVLVRGFAQTRPVTAEELGELRDV
ncbi:hypothetical protein GT755_15040 [Herbidospora sp. NEAU-GS84]|uniref:Uncharacterized protein n=1 Tax=Herbidospora solisilvae TaxID=2696284 RepID=A0A7C9JEB8_9ACTN|nr:hypothetical protein [Herbidospora solisilvae]NAS23003.1 hypothetical protein [Herbidospora solisilvae]